MIADPNLEQLHYKLQPANIKLWNHMPVLFLHLGYEWLGWCSLWSGVCFECDPRELLKTFSKMPIIQLVLLERKVGEVI